MCPAARPGRQTEEAPGAVTGICRGFASSAFGMLTVRIPSENEAPTRAVHAVGQRDRAAHRPIGRSWRRYESSLTPSARLRSPRIVKVSPVMLSSMSDGVIPGNCADKIYRSPAS